MSNETKLVLGDLVIPVGAGRNITQTLKPIDNGDVRRTVNGTLLDLTRPENRKYESQIQTTDLASPTLAGIWKGSILTVECISNLYQVSNPASASITVIRDPVITSILGYDNLGAKVNLVSALGVGNRDLTFTSPITYVQFRPIIDFMVLDVRVDKDEFQVDESWTIDLEEV